jgi:AbiV family abortive infection protein
MSKKDSREPISWKTLPECLRLCILNSKGLLKDASRLSKEKRYSSATALAVLAIEELGKGQMAFESAIKKNDICYSKYRNDLCDHNEKMKVALKIYKDIPTANDYFRENIEKMKFDAFYVDYNWMLHNLVKGRMMELPFEDSPIPIKDVLNITFGNEAKKSYSDLQKKFISYR